MWESILKMGFLAPIRALIIYEKVSGKETIIYAEQHPINEDGTFGPGTPLSEDVFKSIANRYTTPNKLAMDKMFNNVRYFNSNMHGYCVIYQTEQKEMQLNFASKSKIKSGKYLIPPLLWVATNNSVKVFAYYNNTLLNAPFWNVDHDGDICWGNNRFPMDNKLSELMSLIETTFFGSEFTHSRRDGKDVKSNMASFYNNILPSCKKYPFEMLVKADIKLNDLWK